jgi:hypothetical protein
LLLICLRRDGSKRRVIEGYLWFLPIQAGAFGDGFRFGLFGCAAIVCLLAYGVGLVACGALIVWLLTALAFP